MQPPSSSLRSRTQTFQPAFESKRGPGERVDPGADEDRVESRHGADANQCGTRLTCHSVV